MFGREQFSAERGSEGSRTYVYVTAASSQPKRANDFFFSFSFKMTACCLQTTTTIKAAELFHPSVFTPTIFSFLYYYYDFALVEQSTPWLKNHLRDLPSPDAPVGAALRQAQFHQAARTGDRQFSLLLVHGQDE